MTHLVPKQIHGNDRIDPWRDEQMQSLFDGRARYKVPQDDEQERRRKITLPKYDPAFLR